MKAHVFNSVLTAVLLSAIVPALLMAAPQVFTYTDKSSYQAGDTIKLRSPAESPVGLLTIWISTYKDAFGAGQKLRVGFGGDNMGEEIILDVYIGLIVPDGTLYVFAHDAWSESVEPWARDVLMPSGYGLSWASFFSFDIPCEMPPIGVPGQYAFAAVVTEPGTFNWACPVRLAPFTVVETAELDFHVDASLGDDANEGSEDAPWQTITHALDSVQGSAATAVTIHVAPGTYSASTNGESFPLNMKSFVSLFGKGADLTVLNAEHAANPVICCFEVDDSIIEGFTITGGSCPLAGGGIYCQGGSPMISNNMITGNSARRGAGIYCNGGWPTFSDNIISDNSADDYYGGGGRALPQGRVV